MEGQSIEKLTLESQPLADEEFTGQPLNEPASTEPPKDDAAPDDSLENYDSKSQQATSESEVAKSQPTLEQAQHIDDDDVGHPKPMPFDRSKPDIKDDHFKDKPPHHGPFEIIIQHTDGREFGRGKVSCFFILSTNSYARPVALTVFHLLTGDVYDILYQEIIQRNAPNRPAHPEHIKDYISPPARITSPHLLEFMFRSEQSLTDKKESTDYFLAVLNQLLSEDVLQCYIQHKHGRNGPIILKGSSFMYGLPFDDSCTNADAVLVEVCKLDDSSLDSNDRDALKLEMCGKEFCKIVDYEKFSKEKVKIHSEIDPNQLEDKWYMKGETFSPIDLEIPITDEEPSVYFVDPKDKSSDIIQFVFKHSSCLTNQGDSGRGIFVYGKSGSECFNIVAMMSHINENNREYSFGQPIDTLIKQFFKHNPDIYDIVIIGKVDTPSVGS